MKRLLVSSLPGWKLLFLLNVVVCLSLARSIGDADHTDKFQEAHDLQTLAFRITGTATFGTDVAHLHSRIRLTDVVAQYNHLLSSLDAHHDQLINRPEFHENGPLKNIAVRVNHTWTLLHIEAREVQRSFDYVCNLLQIECQVYRPTKNFRHSKTQHWISQLAPPPPQSTNPHSDEHRSKRNVFVEAATAGLSIYNLIQTQRLAGKLDSVESNQELIAAQLNHQREIITEEQDNVDKVLVFSSKLATITSSGLSAQIQTEVLILARQELSLLHNWVRDLIRTIIDQRLMPSFFRPVSIDAAMVEIRTQAKVHDLEPVLPSTQLVDMPLSFVVKNDTIILIAHIYLARPNRFKLYQFIPIPLRHPSGNLSQVVTDGLDFLALNREGSEYLSLTADDLATCTIQREIHLCDFGLTKRTAAPDCLLSLFQGKMEDVAKLCHFSPTTQLPSVTAISKDTIYIVADQDKELHSLSYNCHASRTQATKMVPSRHSFTVPRDCIYTSDKFIFRPSRRFDIRSGFKTTTLANFPELESLKTVAVAIVAPNVTHHRLEPFELDPINDKGHLGLVVALVSVIGLAATGVATFCLHRSLKLVKATHKEHAAKLQTKIAEMAAAADRSLEDIPLLSPTPSAPTAPDAVRLLANTVPALQYRGPRTASLEPFEELRRMFSADQENR